MTEPNNPPIVYIDGENFSFRVAELLIANEKIKDKSELITLDIRGLFEKSLSRNDLVIRYYGTRVKIIKDSEYLEAKTDGIIRRQRKLRNSLAKQGVKFIESGKLKARDGDTCKECGSKERHLQEKGVDVKIAVDIVTESSLGRDFYLVSSDTDLLPAIEASNANITYVAFPGKLTRALCKATGDRVVVIREAEVLEAFANSNPYEESLRLRPKE